MSLVTVPRTFDFHWFGFQMVVFQVVIFQVIGFQKAGAFRVRVKLSIDIGFVTQRNYNMDCGKIVRNRIVL